MSPRVKDEPSGHDSAELPINSKRARSAVRREAVLVSAMVACNVSALPILRASVGMIRNAVDAAPDFLPHGATQ